MLRDIVRLVVCVVIAAACQHQAALYALVERGGREAIGGEIFVFPIVLIASYYGSSAVMRLIKRRVKRSRRRRKYAYRRL